MELPPGQDRTREVRLAPRGLAPEVQPLTHAHGLTCGRTSTWQVGAFRSGWNGGVEGCASPLLPARVRLKREP
ncbi:hypothetical protein DB31_7408 [Hyalangium minutum]|uniref:Uncharacterized protein n=1 Tax=Hyalangium minutum TaxID=394096 RepID=A0A085WKF8_9BACT|nr:hypothetical protein DB31_7408 [Hyalangium minutum]